MSTRANHAALANPGPNVPERRTAVQPPSIPASAAGGRSGALSNIPFIRCTECGHREPAGYLGNTSGEVVVYHPTRFMDDQGFYYCRNPACAIVWNSLPIERVPVPGPTVRKREDPYSRVGGEAPWVPEDETGRGWFRLRRVQRNVNVSFNLAARGNQSLRRAGDRVRDAATVCNALGLPEHVRDAVEYHIVTAVSRVKWSALVSGRFPREETFTLATVALVAERHHYHLNESTLLNVFRFEDGNTVDPMEFQRVKRALRGWFENNVW